MLKKYVFHRKIMHFSRFIQNKLHISNPKFNEQINQLLLETWIIIFPKSIIILVKERNSNLPKPTL